MACSPVCQKDVWFLQDIWSILLPSCLFVYIQLPGPEMTFMKRVYRERIVSLSMCLFFVFCFGGSAGRIHHDWCKFTMLDDVINDEFTRWDIFWKDFDKCVVFLFTIFLSHWNKVLFWERGLAKYLPHDETCGKAFMFILMAVHCSFQHHWCVLWWHKRERTESSHGRAGITLLEEVNLKGCY